MTTESNAWPDAAPAPTGKKNYAPPTLLVFGSIASLTRSATCTVKSDGETVSGCVAGNMAMQSDSRLKENVRQVGVHPLGFGLYLFDYKPQHRDRCGHGRQFGVMADEVEQVMPDAVTVGADGYKAVYYGMLGISKPAH